MTVEWIDTDKWNRMCSGSGSWRLMVTPSLAYKGDILIVAVDFYDTSTDELAYALLIRLNTREGGMELCLNSYSNETFSNEACSEYRSFRAYDSRLPVVTDSAISAYIKLLIKETIMQFKEELAGSRIEHKCIHS